MEAMVLPALAKNDVAIEIIALDESVPEIEYNIITYRRKQHGTHNDKNKQLRQKQENNMQRKTIRATRHQYRNDLNRKKAQIIIIKRHQNW